MGDEELEVNRQLRTSQDKYTYFLLAVSASAIAFAIQKTTDDILKWSMIPLGLAVVCWGYSFYCGCMYVRYVNSILYANGSYLQILSGKSELKQEQIPHALKGINDALNINYDRANNYGNNQFYFIIAGAVFFIVWHITLMVIRTFFCG